MIEAFNLGPLLIPTRSLILIVSVIFAIWVSQRLSQKFGLERHPVKRITENSAWFGLAGARLGFVALNWSAYSATPWTALYFWQPGYHFISGILVGSAYAIWQISRKPDRLRPTFFKVLLGSYLAAGLLFFSAPLSLELLKDPAVPGTGDQATDFTLQNFSAETVKLSDLAGRGVVLNFWATWCPPCRREMPLLDEMQKVYADRGLSIIGVDLD
ncbi:MAG: thiol-disulfide isomerase/thioredoxin, partial [Gammaproteobacteria bacterium]